MTETTLSSLLDTAWSHLTRGVADRKHPARHPTLATLGPDGPELRTLVLRGADRAAATLELFTDAASPKALQIAADPRVALHVWLPKPQLQIRARARAAILPGDPALFARLPAEAQANYSGTVPGTPLETTGDRPTGGAARFARITCTLAELDILHLGTPHIRALYRASDGWQGQWVAP
ncbi:pyridoxamine 5'-phosphate oxidase family protein [Roseicyclus sp.]